MEIKVPGRIRELQIKINVLFFVFGLSIIYGVLMFIWIGSNNIGLDEVTRSNEVWIQRQIELEKEVFILKNRNYLERNEIMPSAFKGELKKQLKKAMSQK